MVLHALAALDDALDLTELAADELSVDEFAVDDLAADELDLIAELALETIAALELGWLEAAELFALELIALELRPVPAVGIEHSLLAFAGLGSVPKVAVLHTKVPLSTL